MKGTDIRQLIDLILAREIRGDAFKWKGQVSIKQRFKDLATAYLKLLVKELGLKDFDIHFNPGGPAISGEVTLRSDRIYVQINGEAWGVLYRRCVRADKAPKSRAAQKKAKPNYESAQFANQWLGFEELADVPKVVLSLKNLLEQVQKGA